MRREVMLARAARALTRGESSGSEGSLVKGELRAGSHERAAGGQRATQPARGAEHREPTRHPTRAQNIQERRHERADRESDQDQRRRSLSKERRDQKVDRGERQGEEEGRLPRGNLGRNEQSEQAVEPEHETRPGTELEDGVRARALVRAVLGTSGMGHPSSVATQGAPWMQRRWRFREGVVEAGVEHWVARWAAHRRIARP